MSVQLTWSVHSVRSGRIALVDMSHAWSEIGVGRPKPDASIDKVHCCLGVEPLLSMMNHDLLAAFTLLPFDQN